MDFLGNAHVWISYGGTTYFWDLRLPLNCRTNLAAACAPAGVSLYINGQDMGPHNGHAVPTAPVEVKGTTFIGRGNRSGESINEFCGEIDHVAVYNAFLSADETALAMHAAKAEGYVDFFEHGAGPAAHWDQFDGSGFNEQIGLLLGSGFRGPHEIMATVPTTDHEVSFWYRYTDHRARTDIEAGEQAIQFSLRRGLWASADLFLEISPEAFTLYERLGRTTKRILVNDGVKSEPNTWYSVRMRVLGEAIRVWRRADDGAWHDPLIRADKVLDNSYEGAGYGFTIDAPTEGRSDYALDNLRVRPFRGNIDANVGEIDVHPLTIQSPEGSTSSIVPRGGVFPNRECVYIAAEGTGDYVFRGWEPVNADTHNAPNAQDLRIILDAPTTLTAQLRPRYCGSHAAYQSASYDSTYAPGGYTTVSFAELVQVYTVDMNTPSPTDDQHYPYLPATVILTVPDYPDDDPLREVVIDSIDAAKNTVCKYPVGTEITARAIPMLHPLGFSMNLFAWQTTPGTAIHNCPSPGNRNRFTMPSLADEAERFILDIAAPEVKQLFEVVFPTWGEPSLTFGLSKGCVDFVPISAFPNQTIWRYYVIAPRGEVGSVESNCIDLYENFRSPVGLINPRSGMPQYSHDDPEDPE